MADEIMAVDERLARLEVTVANGFSEQNGRITSLEHKVDTLDRKVDALGRRADILDQKVDGLSEKVDALNSKLDVVSESLEGKIHLVLERLDSRTGELQASIETMQNESRADRRLMYAMLKDHRVRIEALETTARSGGSGSAAP